MHARYWSQNIQHIQFYLPQPSYNTHHLHDMNMYLALIMCTYTCAHHARIWLSFNASYTIYMIKLTQLSGYISVLCSEGYSLVHGVAIQNQVTWGSYTKLGYMG